VTADDLERLYATEAFGPVRVMRAFLPLLRASADPDLAAMPQVRSGASAGVAAGQDGRSGVTSTTPQRVTSQ